MTATTVYFTEEMKGDLAYGPEGLVDAYFMFRLTIETVDIEQFFADPAHQGFANGWVTSAPLGVELPVHDGIFNLFVSTERADTKEMRYRLEFEDSAGRPLTFTGVKYVRDHPGFDLWSDTSTLHTRIVDGDGAVVAQGVIRIRKRDFLRQLTTFRARGGSVGDKVRAFVLFMRLFLGRLKDVYL